MRELTAQPADIRAVTIGTYACELERGERFETHRHPPDQIVWCSAGVLEAAVGDRTWLLPPNLALWVPGGESHSIRARHRAVFRSVYFRPEFGAHGPGAPTALLVTPLLRELIEHLGDLALSPPEQERIGRVICDLLHRAPFAAVALRMPRDERARRVAEALTAQPADDRGLAEWGRIVGASARTLSRLFSEETGLTYTQWCTQLRLRAALEHLAAGRATGTVAHLVGYHDASSFVAAFRRALGCTPGSYRAMALAATRNTVVLSAPDLGLSQPEPALNSG